ncbi:MAG TPA: hypothetical protein VIJ66_11990 [Solirubrobacteraceae bacterium]
MAATKKRTTRPLGPKHRALGKELRAAKARGEDPAIPLYKAMSAEQKVAFVRRRTKP